MRKKEKFSTDKSLAKACARGNERAQRFLYDTYVNPMYATAYRYCFNPQATEDVLQITFSKVFQYIKKYDPEKGSLKSWIRSICINTAKDILKKEAKWEMHLDQEEEVPGDAIETDPFDLDYLLHLIESLPKEQRLIFNLYEIEGYSHEEISSMLGINVNSCRVYLSRAKKRLREAIELTENL